MACAQPPTKYNSTGLPKSTLAVTTTAQASPAYLPLSTRVICTPLSTRVICVLHDSPAIYLSPPETEHHENEQPHEPLGAATVVLQDRVPPLRIHTYISNLAPSPRKLRSFRTCCTGSHTVTRLLLYVCALILGECRPLIGRSNEKRALRPLPIRPGTPLLGGTKIGTTSIYRPRGSLGVTPLFGALCIMCG